MLPLSLRFVTATTPPRFGTRRGSHLFLLRVGLGGESRVDRYVDMNCLVGDNCEGLRSHVKAPSHASFYIQDIITRCQRDAIVSAFVCNNSRNFLFLLLGQDD